MRKPRKSAFASMPSSWERRRAPAPIAGRRSEQRSRSAAWRRGVPQPGSSVVFTSAAFARAHGNASRRIAPAQPSLPCFGSRIASPPRCGRRFSFRQLHPAPGSW
mgnify:CR=1 FL=1